MTLFRASPAEGVAWVTGASSGIGRQIAIDLAAEGYIVIASARGEDKLAELASGFSGKGRIIPLAVDVTERERMSDAVHSIEREHGPITLAIFCAGNYFPMRGEKLDVETFENTYRINYFGVLNGLVPTVEAMKTRRKGHVVIVASVSGYSGLPMASAYGSSKAALGNLAESLKFDFDKLNIRVQLVNPGFIETPLTEKNDFPMPALMPVAKASRRVVDGLRNGGFEITFPRRFTWLLKVMRMMPHPVYFALMKKAMGWDKRPLQP